ncbi:CAP domain-containing protein [Corynebacterium sp. MSK008]|uniref:CAP domain-containing protein n=1 Tax=Corynebacterium sp. MSK008 TaxID=3050188 RepID=UPI00255140B5|nr:CAP domain-containing protein [Corynebacterium sp. MSK008]MDK8878733.1 CAP domain-containing protein [Corynebacterium sp. MSK008]
MRNAEAAVEEAEAALTAAEAELARADVDQRKAELDAAEEVLKEAERELVAKQEALTAAEEDTAALAEDVTFAEETAATANETATAAAAEKADKQQAADSAQAKLADAQAREAAGADYTQEDWERLVADAVVEITNEYRERHGMHPLVSHDVFNDNARDWSGVMSADMQRGGNDYFRHAEFEAYGHSGENIAYNWLGWPDVSPATADRTQWAELPEALFTQWRNSTSGHNEGMLDSSQTGIGVGVRVAPNGQAFATMQFYKLSYPTTSHTFGPDGGSQKANASGVPYYVSTGAREALRTPELTVDLGDRRRANPSYDGLKRDKIRAIPARTTSRLGVAVSHDYAAELSINEAGVSTAQLDLDAAEQQDAATQEALAQAAGALEDAERRLRSAVDWQQRLEGERDALARAEAEATDAKDAAEAELAWAQAADQDALAAAVESARERLADAEQGVEDAYELSAAEQMTLDEAEDYVAEAEAELAQVNAQRPTLAQYTTTETNTAAVVLGVLAALAVVGIGVVALAPQLGIELPWQ